VGVVRLGDVGGLARVARGHDAKATLDQRVRKVLGLTRLQAGEQTSGCVRMASTGFDIRFRVKASSNVVRSRPTNNPSSGGCG